MAARSVAATDSPYATLGEDRTLYITRGRGVSAGEDEDDDNGYSKLHMQQLKGVAPHSPRYAYEAPAPRVDSIHALDSSDVYAVVNDTGTVGQRASSATLNANGSENPVVAFRQRQQTYGVPQNELSFSIWQSRRLQFLLTFVLAVLAFVAFVMAASACARVLRLEGQVSALTHRLGSASSALTDTATIFTAHLTSLEANTTVRLSSLEANTTVRLTSLEADTAVRLSSIEADTAVRLSSIEADTAVRFSSLEANTTIVLQRLDQLDTQSQADDAHVAAIESHLAFAMDGFISRLSALEGVDTVSALRLDGLEGNLTATSDVLSSVTERLTAAVNTTITLAQRMARQDAFLAFPSSNDTSGFGGAVVKSPGITVIGNTTFVVGDAVFLSSPKTVVVTQQRPVAGNNTQLPWNVTFLDVSVGDTVSWTWFAPNATVVEVGPLTAGGVANATDQMLARSILPRAESRSLAVQMLVPGTRFFCGSVATDVNQSLLTCSNASMIVTVVTWGFGLTPVSATPRATQTESSAVFVGNVDVAQICALQARGDSAALSVTYPAVISGDVSISGPQCTSDQLVRLLRNVRTVTGSVVISGSTRLNHVDCFRSLLSIGGSLDINNNSALVSIAGFAALSSVGRDLVITQNMLLTNVDAIAAVVTATVGGVIAIMLAGNVVTAPVLSALQNNPMCVAGGSACDTSVQCILSSVAGTVGLAALCSQKSSCASGSPCNNGGTCVNGAVPNVLFCACAAGYSGSTCLVRDECYFGAMSNGVSCERVYQSTIGALSTQRAVAASMAAISTAAVVQGSVDIVGLPIDLRVRLLDVFLRNVRAMLGTYVTIYSNTALVHLDALRNLNVVGGYLQVYGNPALTSVEGLRGLQRVRNTQSAWYPLYFTTNPLLTRGLPLPNVTCAYPYAAGYNSYCISTPACGSCGYSCNVVKFAVAYTAC